MVECKKCPRCDKKYTGKGYFHSRCLKQMGLLGERKCKECGIWKVRNQYETNEAEYCKSCVN